MGGNGQVKSQVRWPGDTTDPTGRDLGEPIEALLQRTSMLGTDEDVAASSGLSSAFRGTPTRQAALEAGATAIAKWWAAGVAALGGTGATVAAVKGLWSGQPVPVQVATAAGLALLLVATVISISLIVCADLRSRAAGAVALYQARAAVATAFLQLTKAAGPDGDAGTREGRVHQQDLTRRLEATSILGLALAADAQVEASGRDGMQPVNGIRSNAGQVEVRLLGKWVPVEDITEVHATFSGRA